MAKALELTFAQVSADYKARHRVDLTQVKQPKLNVDPEIGARLYDLFFTAMTGAPSDQKALPWKEQNKGRKFNLWHWLMKKGEMKTHSSYHAFRAVITRGMADPNAEEPLHQMFLYPYIASGDKFAAPLIEQILDDYGVDKMVITERIGR